jgi:hypothetical protein
MATETVTNPAGVTGGAEVLAFPANRVRKPRPSDGSDLDRLVDAIAATYHKSKDSRHGSSAAQRAAVLERTREQAAQGDQSAILALQVLRRFRERFPELAEQAREGVLHG